MDSSSSCAQPHVRIEQAHTVCRHRGQLQRCRCGIVGIFKHQAGLSAFLAPCAAPLRRMPQLLPIQGHVSAEIYEALLMLQHRGQDSAGMVTTDGQRFREHRDNGLVREVFGSQTLLDMMAGERPVWALLSACSQM